MATWTITYSDGSTAAVTADDLASATAAIPPAPDGLQFVSIVVDPAPPPPVTIPGSDGTSWAITVDDAGQVTATPVSGDTA